MLHLTTVVSRKTPLDGRLEIPESLADRLASIGGPLLVELPGGESPVTIEEMACTCAKGAGGSHRHHFLSADILRELPAGATASIEADVDEGRIRIDLE